VSRKLTNTSRLGTTITRCLSVERVSGVLDYMIWLVECHRIAWFTWSELIPSELGE